MGKHVDKPTPHLRLLLTPQQTINMTGRGGGGGRKVLLPPINMIFKLLQSVSSIPS